MTDIGILNRFFKNKIQHLLKDFNKELRTELLLNNEEPANIVVGIEKIHGNLYTP